MGSAVVVKVVLVVTNSARENKYVEYYYFPLFIWFGKSGNENYVCIKKD